MHPRSIAPVALALTLLALPGAALAGPSTRVYVEDGRLRSESDDATHRIPDHSHAGYMGGGVPLPEVAGEVMITPVPGDNTASIQAAIDEVAALPVGPEGFRGAVVLAPGRYDVNGTVRVDADGVVLRGAGDNVDLAQNTAIVRVGANEDPVIILGGSGNTRWKNELPDSRSDIVSDYVQVGTMAFEVADPGKYRVGDNIIVFHPCTDAWLASRDYGATGDEPPWAVGSYPLVFNRVITEIDGAMIHIDAPVFDHLDRALAQSYIYKLDRAGLVSHVGIEDLRVEIDTDLVMHAVSFDNVEEAFARDLTVRDFLLGGIHLHTAKHVTVRDVRAVDPKGPTIGGRKYNFMGAGAQLVLVEDGFARGGRHSFASNGTSWDSGIVFLRGVSDESLAASEGHHRWSMGLLYDGHTEVNVVYDGILLGLYNRGHYGTGHGWATAHSVAWNCDLAGGIGVVQQPPLAQNYFIGCSGQVSGMGPFDHPEGFIESDGEPVTPISLYEAQLDDRLAHPPGDPEPPEGYVFEESPPTADAFVRGGVHSGQNYGASELLTVKAGNPDFTREAYLRFSVADVGEYAQVWLRLRHERLAIGGMRYALAAVDPGWDEQTITFDDRPAAQPPFVHFFPEQARDTFVDVTAAVDAAAAAGEPLSLHVWATAYYGGRAFSNFGSREAAAHLRPALVSAVPEPEAPTTGTDGGTSDSDGTGGTDGSTGTGGETDDPATSSGGQGTTAGGDSQGSSSGASTDGGADEGDDAGCACRSGHAPAGWWLLLLLALAPGRRRRGRRTRPRARRRILGVTDPTHTRG